MAKQAYEVLAPSYEDFTLGYGYEYESWVKTLAAKAEEIGLEGNRLLDVGCGTGFSFVPMLDRGWRVTACDIAESMVEIARAKAGGRAELVVADMRELPVLGEFDLVWSVNGPLNYLLGLDELEATLAGMRRNLAPDGLLLFDVLTLMTARSFFAEEIVADRGGKKIVWRGQAEPEEVVPGAVAEGRIEAEGEGDWESVHRMRHYPEAALLAAVEAAGLRCVEVFGETGGALYPGLDEETHSMAVYVCRP